MGVRPFHRLLSPTRHRYKLSRAIVSHPYNHLVQDWGNYLGDATLATTSWTSSCQRLESESGPFVECRACLQAGNELDR